MGENKEFYKDNKEVNNETQYSSEAENFWNKIEKGIVLRECLNIPKELVENKSGQNGWEHIECKPVLSENEGKYKNDDETRLCRCFHFRNVNNNSGCKREKCVIGYYEKNYILNNCNVLDHEVRTEYRISGIGRFDLILEYKKTNYAVEVKPQNSPETILRMILEILTYDFCNCYNKDNPDDYNHNKERAIIKNNKADDNDKMKSGIYYELGIAFFQESKQYHQFEEHKKNQDVIIKILKKYKISVFIISKDEDKNGYTIEKQDLC